MSSVKLSNKEKLARIEAALDAPFLIRKTSLHASNLPNRTVVYYEKRFIDNLKGVTPFSRIVSSAQKY